MTSIALGGTTFAGIRGSTGDLKKLVKICEQKQYEEKKRSRAKKNINTLYCYTLYILEKEESNYI